MRSKTSEQTISLSNYRDLCNNSARSATQGQQQFCKILLYIIDKVTQVAPLTLVSEVDTLCPITRSVTHHYKTIIVFCSPLQLSHWAFLFFTFCPARFTLDIQIKKSHKKLDPGKKSCQSKDSLQTVFGMLLAIFSPKYYPLFSGTTAGSGSPDDYSLFLSENGHLSFENPNYQASLVLLISTMIH